MSWYEKAAAAEDPDGLFHLGRTYHGKHGTPGVPDDMRLRMVFGLYRRAAELGQIEAQYVVGKIYQVGVDGMAKQDMDAARGWYRRAADKGHPLAGRLLEQLQAINERASLEGFIDPVNKKRPLN
ncbi:MAG: tetratricopeptide repeat protein [Vicinamibacterales bacterium]